MGDGTLSALDVETSYPGAVGRAKVRRGRDQPSNEENLALHFKGLAEYTFTRTSLEPGGEPFCFAAQDAGPFERRKDNV